MENPAFHQRHHDLVVPRIHEANRLAPLNERQLAGLIGGADRIRSSGTLFLAGVQLFLAGTQ